MCLLLERNKKSSKTFSKNSPKPTSKESYDFSIFLPGPGPPKTWKHRESEVFFGGWRQRPVAKAMVYKVYTPTAEASPDFRADARRRLRRTTWPSISSQGGLESSEIYSLCFFQHIHGIMDVELCWKSAFFFLEQVAKACSRKLLRRAFPKESLPISTFHFV